MCFAHLVGNHISLLTLGYKRIILMEDAAKKTAGVANATVNFMTQKMIVEFEDGTEPKAVMNDVLKACKKVEPDCEIEL